MTSRRPPRKNARVDSFVLEALGFEGARANPVDPWLATRAKIAEHQMHADAARQRARYEPEALEDAEYHDAEAERLEVELEAAGHRRPRYPVSRPPPSRRRNPLPYAATVDDWIEIEDATHAYAPPAATVDDWVTIEECACSSCSIRMNPRVAKRRAEGAYADVESITDVIARALAQHGLTMDGIVEVKLTRGGKSRGGSCSYSRSLHQCKINLNGLAWPVFTEEQRLNTILHEAAHAIQFLTTRRSDHGPVWQRIAKSIGCSGDRCLSLEASQSMADAYAEAKGLPKRKILTKKSAMEASADFAVGDYVSFEHKRERWYGKIVGKDVAHARVRVQRIVRPRLGEDVPVTSGITGKIPYPLLQKEAPPPEARFAEKVAGVDKPAAGESLTAWLERTGRR